MSEAAAGRGLFPRHRVLRVEPIPVVPLHSAAADRAPPPPIHPPSPAPVAGSSRLILDDSAPSRSPSPLTPLSSRSSSPGVPQVTLARTFSTQRDFILSLERQGHVSGTVMENGKEVPVMTHWWETQSDAPIQHPLDLTCRPELRVGDLFLHRTPHKPQMWLWTTSSEGTLEWKFVFKGHQREDGRRLALTTTKEHPTWLEAGWYAKLCRKQGRS
ncbi:hypothetical protein C8T65DRAFT_744055 [Cerioporus squamosus]|nr:hypothetical protein C8T65DRAFT_744055 [Cerioporus squamosus]